MSLRSAMAAFAAENPKLSNYSLARKFLLAVTQKTLIAMLANEFQHIRRGAVRSVEASVAASATAPLKTLKQQKEALEQIRPLLDKRYPTLSGEERELRYMNRAALHARIDMLKGQEEGVKRGREAAERVLALCEAANVECLAEMEVAA